MGASAQDEKFTKAGLRSIQMPSQLQAHDFCTEERFKQYFSSYWLCPPESVSCSAAMLDGIALCCFPFYREWQCAWCGGYCSIEDAALLAARSLISSET
jgi:hypothetical protein